MTTERAPTWPALSKARLDAWVAGLTVRQRVLGLFAIVMAALLALSVWQAMVGRAAHRSYQALARDHLAAEVSLDRLTRYYGAGVRTAWSLQVALGRVSLEDAVQELRAERRKIAGEWHALAQVERTLPAGHTLWARLREAHATADAAVEQLEVLLASGSQPAVMRFYAVDLDRATARLMNAFQDLSDALAALHAQQLALLEQRLREREMALYVTTLVASLLLFVLVPAALRPLYRGIEHLTLLARRLSAREFAARLHWIPPGELGELARALATMQAAVRHYAEELHKREFEARAASQAKSMFVASMSHEIRTPLVGVLGMLELLGRSRLDGEQRRQFAIVHQSAQALLEVVGDILDYSKIEAGKLEIRPEPVALREVVSRVIAMFSATAQSKGLQLTLAFDPGLAPAHLADGAHLMQVLRNFVSNGIKFTERGAVTLAVGVAGGGAETQRVVFTVSDTGIGIARDHLDRLFKPFSQVETGPSRRFGGTGLGLAICSRLAEAMGGAVHADSAPGVGTTMRLELELKVADPAALPRPVAVEPEPPDPRPTANHEGAESDANRILLAEDHPVNRQILTAQLHMAGFRVDAAENGTVALQRFVGGRYGLVLTDLHMPDLDGFQLAAAIRDHEREHGRARTPIVALTADAVREHVERCFASGIDDYLCKPVPMRQLVGKLRQWLPEEGAT